MKRNSVRSILGVVLLAVFAIVLFARARGSVSSGEAAQNRAEAEAAAAATPVPTAAPEPAPAAVIETVEPEATPEPTPEPTPDPDSPEGRAAALGLPAPPEIDVESWEFILANPTHSIEEYNPPEMVTIENQQFDSRIADAIRDFARAARDEGLSVYLSSGYRSYADQNYLYNRKIGQGYTPEQAATIVAPPGTSEHQTGLVCDITDRYYESKDYSLENTALFQWMSAHCQEYGFIVRYPRDKAGLNTEEAKTSVTGIIYEPWHFRYVGTEAAEYIMQNNLCLEEFLALYGVE